MSSQLTSLISGEMCAEHIRVMREQYVDEKDLRCYNCDGLSFDCPDRKPVKNTGMRYSHLRLFEGAVQ